MRFTRKNAPLLVLAMAAALGAAAARTATAQGTAPPDAFVSYDLHDVTFSDGGTASGHFTYNAATGTFGAYDLSTTPGSVFAGAHYADPDNLSFDALSPATPELFAGSDTGGTFALFFSLGFEGVPRPGPHGVGGSENGRGVVSGVAVAAAPEPPSGITLALAGVGTLGLVLRARRRKAAAPPDEGRAPGLWGAEGDRR